jgi:hypothetical protein
MDKGFEDDFMAEMAERLRTLIICLIMGIPRLTHTIGIGPNRRRVSQLAS